MAYVKDDEDEFVRLVMRNKLNARMAEQEQAKRQLEKQERRILELDSIIQRLYEDHVIASGIVSVCVGVAKADDVHLVFHILPSVFTIR